jgi:hypothetical protein
MLVQMFRMMCTLLFPFLVRILNHNLSHAVTSVMAVVSRMFFLSDLHSNRCHGRNMGWMPLVRAFKCSKAYFRSNRVDSQIDKGDNPMPCNNMALELHESLLRPEVC